MDGEGLVVIDDSLLEVFRIKQVAHPGNGGLHD
jgi:hypothetical protein